MSGVKSRQRIGSGLVGDKSKAIFLRVYDRVGATGQLPWALAIRLSVREMSPWDFRDPTTSVQGRPGYTAERVSEILHRGRHVRSSCVAKVIVPVGPVVD